MKNYYVFISILVIVGFSTKVCSAVNGKKSKTVYRTYFGNCPSRTAGTLTLSLLKEFEKSKSLRKLKEKIEREKLAEKSFISKYNVDYNPAMKFLTFSYDCPKPLMKVQIYKESGQESYTAILVESGELYDPTYELVLRQEKKLNRDLPFLAIPIGEMNKGLQRSIATLVGSFGEQLRKGLSEVIVNEDNELTVILSIKGKPSSIFFGQEEWDEKTVQLRKILDYLGSKKKIPAIINLTNSKKIVVKFSG